MKRKLLNLILILALALSMSSLAGAQDGGLEPSPDSPTLESEALSVEKEENLPALQARSIQSLVPAEQETLSVIVTFEKSVNPGALESATNGRLVHRYREVFNGASLVLTGSKLDELAELDGVTGIYLDQLMQPDTEVSPGFIGAPALWNQLGGQGSAGEGTIVGVLDTGIWPEHPSFSDPDPFGNPYASPPVAPGSNGFGSGGARSTCDFGNTAWNPNDAAFTCNNKLIGAYSFLDTYKAVVGLLPEEFDSARDDNGHGTHTTSTSAGNGGVAASIFAIDRGIVSGIAPRAHVIMYRVCAFEGCFQSDSVAAVEQAILDSVDSINFSISGGNAPYTDIVELAFAAAYENGVFVSASAGNSGPTANTVAHRGPWTMTVAASTTDRHFLSTITLEADNSDTLELVGASVTDGISTPTPVIFPPEGEELCLEPFPAGTFNGEIVICERGVIARVAKSFNVAEGGAGGLLLYNPTLQGLATDNHFIPSVHLENDAGEALLDFMDNHTGVMATFTAGTATTVQGDVMAAFSSRGGSGQTLGVNKPDITAPGVQILAGHSPMPSTVEGGLPGELFQAIQGTSMSSPHIAGSAALVKALHPDWTPGQIKSALMMTATPAVVKEDGSTPADAFDYGSGRVDLSRAGDPGLTISDTTANFFALQNELWNANYPSLYVPVMPGVITVQRTVHSELNKNSSWRLSVDGPGDLQVSVPRTINVKAGGDTTFDISLDARDVPLGEVRHATLHLTHKGTSLRFPITIVRQQPAVTLDKSCEPGTIALEETTDCTITIANTAFTTATVSLVDHLPPGLPLVPGSVVGAEQTGAASLSFEGTLAPAEPPIVNVAVDPSASPFGYVPLAGFGGTIVIGATDESIHNFNIPSFTYAGETFSRIGIVSNGYVVVGGGTGADVDFVNSDLPDPAVPNNVLAPFWTDLNPASGGQVLINVLTDGVDVWTIVEWESVPNFGDGETNTVQIWIGTNTDTNPGEDIFFVYGSDVSDGDGGFLTVGAENKFGNSGGTIYFNGTGTPPAPTNTTGYAVDVFSTPGTIPGIHTITFTARGEEVGPWTNCAEMTSNLFQGVNVACFSGETTP